MITQINIEWKRAMPYSLGGGVEKNRVPSSTDKGKGITVGNPAPVTSPPCRNTPIGGVTPNGNLKTPVKAKVYAITPRKVDLEADEAINTVVITSTP